MVGESNQNVILIQKDALSFAKFEMSEFEISRVDCTFIFFIIVPSKGPDNVSAYAVSSTSINVTWGDVPALDQNGMIQGFKVKPQPHFRPTTFLSGH